MAVAAARMLADVPPITVTIGRILYHPEAIMLAARPADALMPVLEAATEATRQVTGNPGRSGSKLASWTPHVTIAYSTARQPASPIINALGMALPEREVKITAVSLVSQRGAERGWDWHELSSARWGTICTCCPTGGRRSLSPARGRLCRRPRAGPARRGS